MSQPNDAFGLIAALARAAAMTLPSETTKSSTTETEEAPKSVAGGPDDASYDETE